MRNGGGERIFMDILNRIEHERPEEDYREINISIC